MFNVNKVIVAGNLTQDPELKALPSGQNVCNLTIATNETYTNKDGERKENTEFHNIVIFGKQAENTAKYLSKGSGALVEGKLQTRNWEKDNVKHYRTEIIAQSIQFGEKPNQLESKPDNAKSVLPEYPAEDIDESNIPF